MVYLPGFLLSEYAYNKGVKNALKYLEPQLLEMLQSTYMEEIYESLGAIFTRKMKSALPYLKSMALYDEDIALQHEAIITIRELGAERL